MPVETLVSVEGWTKIRDRARHDRLDASRRRSRTSASSIVRARAPMSGRAPRTTARGRVFAPSAIVLLDVAETPQSRSDDCDARLAERSPSRRPGRLHPARRRSSV
jgi:hypothetical protein